MTADNKKYKTQAFMGNLDKKTSLLEIIKTFADNTPKANALIEGMTGKQISYGDFWRYICYIADEFTKLNLKKGDCVSLLSEQSIIYMACYYGVQLAGGVASPVESGAAFEMLQKNSAAYGAKFLVAKGKVYDGEGHEVLLTISDNWDFLPEANILALPDPDALSLILSTTGTTGKSKGVMSSFYCRYCGAHNVADSYGLSETDTALIPQMMSHSGGLRRTEAMLVCGGAAVIMNPTMYFGNVFGALNRHNCTVLQLVPAQVAQILNSAEKLLIKAKDQLKILSVGSAVIPESHKEKLRELLPGVRLFNDFGSTEATGSAYFEWSKYPPLPNCVGVEAIHSKIVFLDDNGTPFEATEQTLGLIATEGDAIMMGYYGDEALTNDTIVAGRVISSDLGYRSEDGMIYLTGRKSDIIVSGAFKISPSELEDAASKVPGVIECAAVARPDSVMGQLPVLFITINDAFSKDTFIKELSTELESYKIPKANNIFVVDELPKTMGTGKVIKRELIERIK